MAEAVVNTSGEEHYLLPVRIYLRDAPYISTVAEAAVNTSGEEHYLLPVRFYIRTLY